MKYKPERKRKNLIRLGVEIGLARAWSRTRKGGRALRKCPVEIFGEEPACRGRTYSAKPSYDFGWKNVRSAPRQLQLAGPSTRLPPGNFLFDYIY
jgi:hypothetical protein